VYNVVVKQFTFAISSLDEFLVLLHILMINRVINCPTVSYRYSELNCQRLAERAENRVERSGAVNGRCRKTTERSGARSGRSRSGNGAESGGYRNRLERGAAFSPAPLRSHALVIIPGQTGKSRLNLALKIKFKSHCLSYLKPSVI